MKEHRAARFKLTAFSMENGSPRRMVRSTRRPCQRITAVQQPENSKNSVSITLLGSWEKIQNQESQLAAAPAAGMSSSPGNKTPLR